MPASKLSQPQLLEPVVRQAISAINQSQVKVMGLPSTNYNHLIDVALKATQEARAALQAWARALEIQLHESMPT